LAIATTNSVERGGFPAVSGVTVADRVAEGNGNPRGAQRWSGMPSHGSIQPRAGEHRISGEELISQSDAGKAGR
jgi:hypothetical protein